MNWQVPIIHPIRPGRQRRYNCGVEAMKSRQLLSLLFLLSIWLPVFGQVLPVKVDEFGPQTNDSLAVRVENFAYELSKNDSMGFAVVNGTPLMKHLIRRKIEGCLRWRLRPLDQVRFVDGDALDRLKVQFWEAPKGFRSPQFSRTTFDYHLPILAAPIELTSSRGTDEYCPIYFDVEWFSAFMNANP